MERTRAYSNKYLCDRIANNCANNTMIVAITQKCTLVFILVYHQSIHSKLMPFENKYTCLLLGHSASFNYNFIFSEFLETRRKRRVGRRGGKQEWRQRRKRREERKRKERKKKKYNAVSNIGYVKF